MRTAPLYTLFIYARQRLLALAVALCVAVGAWAETINWTGNVTAWTQGSGTAANPYLIENGEHLAYLADQVNSGNSYSGKYFKLTNDIQMTSDNVWTPIGSSATNSFRGVFDGGKHEIWGVRPSPAAYMGLFGYTNGATIKNLFVETQIRATQTETMYLGVLVGYATSTTIDNCYAMGQCAGFVYSPKSDIKIYTGGFIGYAVSCTVSNSHNYATVNAIDSICSLTAADNSAYTYAGGIAGYSEKSTYTCVSNAGDVTSFAYSHVLVAWSGSTLNSYAYAGGIVGKGYDELATRSRTLNIHLTKVKTHLLNVIIGAIYTQPRALTT